MSDCDRSADMPSAEGAIIGGHRIRCECHSRRGEPNPGNTTHAFRLPAGRTFIQQSYNAGSQPRQTSHSSLQGTGGSDGSPAEQREEPLEQFAPGGGGSRKLELLHRPNATGGGRSHGVGDDDSRSSAVLYSEDRGIATIKFNRPEVKHAINNAVFTRLADLLRRAEESASVVAVILTGSDGYFTSGADIKEVASAQDTTVPSIIKPVGRFMTCLLNFPKIIVAAVNGPAVGVGVTLLPHCDVTYAYGGKCTSGREGEVQASAEDAATFWTPFFRLAIVPEFCSSVIFPEILGWSLANEMLILGRKLSADEALNSGLVSRVLTADTEEAFLAEVGSDVRRSVLEQYMAKDSSLTFKRLMWSERRPRLVRVLKEEFTELDRRVQAGYPKEALKHLATSAKLGRRSKL